MSRAPRRVILTDATGRPIPRPEPPAKDAGIEERIAYIRAVHAYNDRVADVAHRAFDRAFRDAVRKDTPARQ